MEWNTLLIIFMIFLLYPVASENWKDRKWTLMQYTAFGEVISGMEIADKIATAPRGANDRPNQPVHIKKVLLSQAKSTS